MKRKPLATGGIRGLLQDAAVRSTEFQGRTFYAVVDVLRELTLQDGAESLWADIAARRPELTELSHLVTFPDSTSAPSLDLPSILRLAQSVPGERAERIRWWLAESGQHRLEESEDPELALVRTRRLYESKGHDRRWVDQRLRGTVARQNLTAEWYRRGAASSDDYRSLTNDLFRETFGMDVDTLRQTKGTNGTTEHLRDHMSELELTVTALAETLAASLHREHHTTTLTGLKDDVTQAGQIAGKTLQDFKDAIQRPLATAPAA